MFCPVPREGNKGRKEGENRRLKMSYEMDLDGETGRKDVA